MTQDVEQFQDLALVDVSKEVEGWLKFLGDDPRRRYFLEQNTKVRRMLVALLEGQQVDRNTILAAQKLGDVLGRNLDQWAQAVGLNLKTTLDASNLATAADILSFMDVNRKIVQKAEEQLEKKDPAEYAKLTTEYERRRKGR
jgi:hypothetical protein